MSIKSFFGKLKAYADDNKSYIKSARSEISENNYRMLSMMTWVYLGVMLAYFTVFIFLFSNTKRIAITFSVMGVLQLLFSFYVMFILKKHKSDFYLVSASCIFFGALIMTLVYLVCIPPLHYGIGIIFPPVLILMSLIYTLPIPYTVGMLTGFSAIYIILSAVFRPYVLLSTDILGTLIAYGIALISDIISFNLRKKEYKTLSKLRLYGMTDGLTGFYTKTEFELRAARRLSEASPATFYMIDIDDFKSYNDTYGHQTGDNVISELSEAMKKVFPNGIIGRFGGDEFTVLTEGYDPAEAENLATRMCRAANGVFVGAGRARLSVSIGIAPRLRGSSLKYAELLYAADTALYRAKRNGKDTYSFI